MRSDQIPADAVAAALRPDVDRVGVREVARWVAERTGRNTAATERWIRAVLNGERASVSVWVADSVLTPLDISIPDERCDSPPRRRRPA